MSLSRGGFLMISKHGAHTDVLLSLFTIISFFHYWIVHLSRNLRDWVTFKTSVQVGCNQQTVVVAQRQRETRAQRLCFHIKPWCRLEKGYVVSAVSTEQFQSGYFLGNVRVRGLEQTPSSSQPLLLLFTMSALLIFPQFCFFPSFSIFVSYFILQAHFPHTFVLLFGFSAIPVSGYLCEEFASWAAVGDEKRMALVKEQLRNTK